MLYLRVLPVTMMSRAIVKIFEKQNKEFHGISQSCTVTNKKATKENKADYKTMWLTMGFTRLWNDAILLLGKHRLRAGSHHCSFRRDAVIRFCVWFIQIWKIYSKFAQIGTKSNCCVFLSSEMETPKNSQWHQLWKKGKNKKWHKKKTKPCEQWRKQLVGAANF